MLYKLYNWFTRCCSDPETAIKNNHLKCLKEFESKIKEMRIQEQYMILALAGLYYMKNKNILIYLVEELGLKFGYCYFGDFKNFTHIKDNFSWSTKGEFKEDLFNYVIDNWDFGNKQKEDLCARIFHQTFKYDWETSKKMLLVTYKRGILNKSFFEKHKKRFIGDIPLTPICIRFLVEELGFDLKEFIPSIDYLERYYYGYKDNDTLEDIEWVLSYISCPLTYEYSNYFSLMRCLIDKAEKSLSKNLFILYPNIQKLVFSKEHGDEKCKCNNEGSCPFARLTKTI